MHILCFHVSWKKNERARKSILTIEINVETINKEAVEIPTSWLGSTRLVIDLWVSHEKKTKQMLLNVYFWALLKLRAHRNRLQLSLS